MKIVFLFFYYTKQMAYNKVFLRWGAEEKTFDRWKIMKVWINFDDLSSRVKSWELRLSDSWTLYFDICEKKPEKQKTWESTHYLVQNQKMTEEEEAKKQEKVNDDLPF